VSDQKLEYDFIAKAALRLPVRHQRNGPSGEMHLMARIAPAS
jgi:hypothetical protein